jgi:putative sigma-54 modulation protein
MRLELTGRHVPITPGVRKLVAKQLAPALRMLNDNAVSTQVVLTREKSRHTAEVTLHARGDNFLHGAGSGRDIGAALGAAMDKIERQALKVKGKWDGRKRRRVPPLVAPEPSGAAEAGQDVRIIKARRYAVKPLTIGEAALEVAETTDAFIVFRNATNDAITVLFRRKDGHLGLIEPEA